jgi:putative ABC transport system permease protein
MKKHEMSTMRIKLMREILEAKVRFLAITFVVVIGVMIFIGSSMSYRNLKTSYEYTYQQLNFADFRVKAERIPRYVVEKCSAVPGITMTTPRVRKDTAFAIEGGKRLIGRVTGIPTQRPIVDNLLIKEGRFFKSGDDMVCIAESHFAEFYKLHAGDTIFYIKNGVEVPVKIVGVASSPEYLVLAGEKGDFSSVLSVTAMAILYMPISDVQVMADLPNEYNQVLFKVKDPKNMEPQIAAVEEIMKDTAIQELLTQQEHQGNKMLQMDLDGFKSFALFFLGIACFSIYILLSRLVYTQRPFIGVMRAMGYSRRQILIHYLSFALAIGVLGAFVGAIGGYGLSYIVAGIYAGTIGIPLVRVNVYWLVIFQGMLLSVAFCAVAGIIPALSSALQDPSEAMRGETLQQKFKMPLAERLLPPLSRLPMFLKVPLRNLFRNKRRTAFTVIGLMFSVMIVLIFLAILNTSGEALNRGFHTNNKFDMVAVFMGGRDNATINKIERIPGVESVEPTVSDEVTFSWNGSSMDTVMTGIEPDTVMRHFSTPDGEEVNITNRHVLLNQWFHLHKGINVGDTITLKTPYRDKKFIVSPFIEEPLGNIAYIDRAEARELMAYGQTSRGSFYVRVLPGGYLEARNALENLIYGLLAIIPGCILGVLVGKYAMGLQSSEYMTLSLVVYPSSYFLVAFGILVILLICQVPSLQYVKRVELAEATKERGG